MPLSVTQSQAFLNAIFGTGNPATWYLALYVTEPTAFAAGQEMNGDTYARVALTNNNTNFTGASSSSPSVISNGTVVTFATPGANWPNIGFWGLHKTSTGGAPDWFGSFATPLAILAGNPVVINANNLNLALG